MVKKVKSSEELPVDGEISEEKRKLVHRLNRLQGQIDSVRRSLLSNKENNCLETIQMIKAANQAMKKFGEAYLHYHLDNCMRENISPEKVEEELKNVIHSAFSM